MMEVEVDEEREKTPATTLLRLLLLLLLAPLLPRSESTRSSTPRAISTIFPSCPERSPSRTTRSSRRRRQEEGPEQEREEAKEGARRSDLPSTTTPCGSTSSARASRSGSPCSGCPSRWSRSRWWRRRRASSPGRWPWSRASETEKKEEMKFLLLFPRPRKKWPRRRWRRRGSGPSSGSPGATPTEWAARPISSTSTGWSTPPRPWEE